MESARPFLSPRWIVSSRSRSSPGWRETRLGGMWLGDAVDGPPLAVPDSILDSDRCRTQRIDRGGAQVLKYEFVLDALGGRSRPLSRVERVPGVSTVEFEGGATVPHQLWVEIETKAVEREVAPIAVESTPIRTVLQHRPSHASARGAGREGHIDGGRHSTMELQLISDVHFRVGSVPPLMTTRSSRHPGTAVANTARHP